MLYQKSGSESTPMDKVKLTIHQGVVSPDAAVRRQNINHTRRCIELACELGIPSMRLNSGRWGTVKSFSDLMKNEGHEPDTVLVHSKTYYSDGEWYTLDLAYGKVAQILREVGPPAWRRPLGTITYCPSPPRWWTDRPCIQLTTTLPRHTSHRTDSLRKPPYSR